MRIYLPILILIIDALFLSGCTTHKKDPRFHESKAIQQIGMIETAQTQYYSQFGKYAQNLAELGPPLKGAAGPSAADFIPGDISQGKKDGYVFTLQRFPTGYTITAVPKVFGTTGRRTFYSDQTTPTRP